MSSHRHRRRYRKAFNQEFNDLLRGAAGGFLFGIPLLYTMEVWWIGSWVEPPIMLAAIVAMLVVVFALNLTEGFRKSGASTAREALSDTVDAVAIGLVSATLMLVLLREITLQTQLREALGKIIFEGVPFALGAALANQFLQPADGDNDSPPNSQGTLKSKALKQFFPKENLNETLADIGVTLMGALIVAFSIAPTEEVPTLVGAVEGPWLLGVVLASLGISYMIVFQANFTRQSQRQMQQGLFQSPPSETVMSYLVSLGAAAVMLGFFQQISWSTPWEVAFRHILILGLPTTIGGAAGRLAL
ncbi:TIGR02587 family membrane protein [Oscillatoria sp. CS-180]|uniref:TIGR02587 family membrane protein n=1 Tax=Oscillatoria sp. CS-180 TaxID=3021720 RepID=UPI002330F7A3|nr:TIGR02587 family membrane protein [Oscillatoria sp. CS-180]MDB9526496.1 TIGR02587 family membrane protein [Oscillatoria sp. CS-180]